MSKFLIVIFITLIIGCRNMSYDTHVSKDNSILYFAGERYNINEVIIKDSSYILISKGGKIISITKK